MKKLNDASRSSIAGAGPAQATNITGPDRSVAEAVRSALRGCGGVAAVATCVGLPSGHVPEYPGPAFSVRRFA